VFEDLRNWDGELVASRFDDPTSTWMFVGVHSTVLGPGFGGTRLKVYPDPADALRDALRLSSAMTSKNALAGLPFGGGKAVLAVTDVPAEGHRRRLLLERYADLVGSLGGSYVTACDMNTTEADMDVVGARCPHVMGMSAGAGGSGSSSPATATGVFHGIRAALERASGATLDGATVVIQGAGAVGGRLAQLLADAGSAVVVADVDEGRARSVADRIGGKHAGPDDAYDVPCDVFAPCATGAVLNARTIPRLRSRVVAGAANNQLSTPGDADRLAEAGVLYAPDFVVNAGGVLHLAGSERLGWTADELQSRLAAIAGTLADVFDVAEREGVSTHAAASQLAKAKIDSARR
jgi:leucine dehydrogenase